MKILLINANPVVSRLISLCMRDSSSVFEEVKYVTEASESAYDIVFVDDASYNDKVAAFSNWVAKVNKLVLLSSRNVEEEAESNFDHVVKKPFLPSQIQVIINEMQEELAQNGDNTADIFPSADNEGEDDAANGSKMHDSTPLSEEEEHFIFPLSTSEGPDDSKEDVPDAVKEDAAADTLQILDGNEIDQIKALLDEDDEDVPVINLDDEEELAARKIEVITKKLEEHGLEIVEENEIVEALSQAPKADKKQQKKSVLKEDVHTLEEALLEAIENMNPKKIKKLLKGAEVTIKIRFKDED